MNFFADDLVNQDARIVWLQPALAQRLSDHMRQLPRKALHQPAYNLIARPGSPDYQNSTAWVLEILAAVMPVSGLTNVASRMPMRATTVSNRTRSASPIPNVRSILRYLRERGNVIREREWRNGRVQSIPGPV